MAVAIRLRREGALNRPYFKVVVADKRSPRDGKFIEIVGTYDPKKPGLNSTLKLDRIEHWISKGAQPSDTVRSLIKKYKNPEAAAKKAEAAAAKKAAKPKAAPKTEAGPSPEPAAEAPAVSAPTTSAAAAATEEKSA
ncbi:MAG TPA: 30S ribosomal protein S16 [Chthoniobacterales bacterium]|nr:30S ribosomal protein S16 [Chthoniobacterales bacterium]